MYDSCINQLVNSRQDEVIFGTCLVQAGEVDINLSFSFFFVTIYHICEPIWEVYFFNGSCCKQLVDLFVDNSVTLWIEAVLFLLNWIDGWINVQVVNHRNRQELLPSLLLESLTTHRFCPLGLAPPKKKLFRLVPIIDHSDLNVHNQSVTFHWF